ncbi:MAG: PaaI family thioesterase [Dehalococcoidia bacterium]|nr:PaaI family thioesterase [Dehalococcoidia bacterium]
MNEDPERRGRMCFACGEKNERGLHMQFRREGERAVCDYTPCAYQQGYPGRMHGGVVATLIDEAMGWAVYHAAAWAATARLSVRFRRPVQIDVPLRIEAWVTRDRSRLIELRAEVRDASGALLAEGDGAFMTLDARFADELSGLAVEVGREDAPPVSGAS